MINFIEILILIFIILIIFSIGLIHLKDINYKICYNKLVDYFKPELSNELMDKLFDKFKYSSLNFIQNFKLKDLKDIIIKDNLNNDSKNKETK